MTFIFENVRVLGMIKELDNFINSLLNNLEKRQREILIERFGFKDGERKTLQAIGDSFGITRERVRQIENQGMEKLRSSRSGNG